MSISQKESPKWSPKDVGEHDSVSYKLTNQKLREMHAKIIEIYERAAIQADEADSKALCLHILQSLKDIRTVGDSASKLFEEALSQ